MPSSWKESGLRWYWIAVLVILADQLTKQWILANFKFRETIEVLPLFNLTYARNYGAAFSFLSDAGGWQKWMFSIIAIGFSTVLTIWLRKQDKSLWRTNLAFTLVIGGAIGNLIDRLYHGFVVDFLDFYWGTSHFPAFNVADSAICVGAALIILDSFITEKEAKNKQNQAKG